MSASAVARVSFVCSICGEKCSQQVPVFLHTETDPELLEQAREGSIHRLTCHNGHSVDGLFPLLVYRPGARPSFAYFLCGDDTGEIIVDLVYLSRTSVGSDWDDAREAGVWILPRGLLPMAMENGFDAAEELNRRRTGVLSQILEIPRPEQRSSQLRNQCGRHLLRYQETGDRSILDTAVACGEQAAAIAPPHSSELGSILCNLGACYLERADAGGNQGDLDKALGAFRTAATLRPHDAGAWNNLSIALARRHRAGGSLADITEAIEAADHAVGLTPADSDDLPALLDNLATALTQLNDASISSEHLNRAIDVAKRALILTPPGSPSRPGVLSNLSASLRGRYDRSGALSDVAEAVEYAREAVALAPSKSPYRRIYLNQLGRALEARYYRTNNLADLQEAVRNWTEAVEAADRNGYPAGVYLNNLGIGYLELYRRSRDPEDLSKAIQCSRRAVSSEGDDPRFRNGLGNVLFERYKLEHRREDLEEAIAVHRRALAETAEDATARPTLWNNLGDGLLERFRVDADPADRIAACAAFRSACEEGMSVSMEEVVRSSRNWGSFLFKREEWTEAAHAYSYGLQAVEQLVGIQLTREGKATWLRTARGLHTNAAYALTRSGDYRSAVAVLEQGRARMLAEALERARLDLASLLEAGEARLWERYRAAVEHLSAMQAAGARPGEFDSARHEWQAVVAAIRSVPGLEDFLQIPDLADIQQQVAESGALALIYLVTESPGSLALIVAKDSIRPVWCSLTRKDLELLLIRHTPEGGIEGLLPAQLGQMPLPAELDSALNEAGRSLIAHVAAQLRKLRTRDAASLIFLVPFGGLSLLPLHAAIYEIDGIRRSLLDEFTVAWAPSARVLARCRTLAASCDESVRSLVCIGNPLPQQGAAMSLEYAEVEAEEVASLFPGTATLLTGEAASAAAVEDHITKGRYLHFACHGIFEPRDALSSGLLMAHGERLTVASLLSRSAILRARLVVLSACQTAISDFSELPDELAGLPSAFLQAGVPGVVGSLWPVDDVSTALLMVEFYKLQASNAAAGPARNLRQAQLWLRELSGAQIGRLLDQFLKEACDASRISFAVTQEKWRLSTLGANIRPFAHSCYWAAFVAFGT